eukprot:gene29650-35788_t
MESFLRLLASESANHVGDQGRCNGFPYQSHFCEENIYYLAKNLLENHQSELSTLGIELYPIFISSRCKVTPIWRQKAGDPVFWDYHVILYVAEANNKAEGIILDFDTNLSFNSPVLEYTLRSFRPDMDIKAEYRQYLRVLTASEYLECFASDRSHMRESNMPFPPWPAIRGSKAPTAMNLMKFVDMTAVDTLSSIPGIVMSVLEFLIWAGLRC